MVLIQPPSFNCVSCQHQAHSPPSAPLHPWEWPKQPWHRIHLDFVGPFMGSMFLVTVDAHSKWLDVQLMSSITAPRTIEKLRQTFAIHGLPKTLVTDNGPTFTSQEFRQFITENGIQHVFSAPYHPSSNGLAERAVQTFKRSLKQMEPVGSLQSRLSKFLFKYNITPHSTTSVSPAELLMGRQLRSRLTLLHPDVASIVEHRQRMQKQGKDNQIPVRVFVEENPVLIKNFARSGDRWLSGTIAKVNGPLSYLVKLVDGKHGATSCRPY